MTASAAAVAKLTTGTGTLNQFRLSLPASSYTNGNAAADYITVKAGAKVVVTYVKPSATPTLSKVRYCQTAAFRRPPLDDPTQ